MDKGEDKAAPSGYQAKRELLKNAVRAGQGLSQSVLAMQAWGPEFDSQNPRKSLAWCHTLVTPVLGKQRQPSL